MPAPNARSGLWFLGWNLAINKIERIDLTDCSGLRALIAKPLTARKDWKPGVEPHDGARLFKRKHFVNQVHLTI
jgi:hypothetical protein